MENKIVTIILVITALIGLISIGYLIGLILKITILDKGQKFGNKVPISPSTSPMDNNEFSSELYEATVSLHCAMERNYSFVKLQFTKIADKPCERIEFLSKKATVIGRASDGDIFIEDTTISRRHLELSFLNYELQIQDLGTTNGTFLNGLRLTPMSLVPVSSGSIVDIGKTSFIIHINI